MFNSSIKICGKLLAVLSFSLFVSSSHASVSQFTFVYDFEPTNHGWDTFSEWWGGAAVNYINPYQGQKSGFVYAYPGAAAAMGRTVALPNFYTRNYYGCNAKAWTLGDKGWLQVWDRNTWTGLYEAYNANANSSYYTEVKTGGFKPTSSMYMRYVVVANNGVTQGSRVDYASNVCQFER